MIDTHAHLYLKQFEEDLDLVIERARIAGVEKIFMPNIDSTTIEAMLRVEKQYPDRCHPMMGLHPCSVEEGYEEELTHIKSWLEKRPFTAIGEIGIDLFWDKSTIDIQTKAFITQVEWSLDLGLPIVIHSRESTDLIIRLLEEFGTNKLKGVFHCFTGDANQMEKILSLGFFLGFGGVLTFKNSGLAETAEKIPMERIVLETDAPYLAPSPFRGKRNESGYLVEIARKLAKIKGLSVEEVEEITSRNARELFLLKN